MADTKFVVDPGTDDEREYDKYYRAYDYAMSLYARDRRQITIQKGSHIILAGDPIIPTEEEGYNVV
jgi:hypothetical protein